jgi:hypothetical protein
VLTFSCTGKILTSRDKESDPATKVQVANGASGATVARNKGDTKAVHDSQNQSQRKLEHHRGNAKEQLERDNYERKGKADGTERNAKLGTLAVLFRLELVGRTLVIHDAQGRAHNNKVSRNKSGPKRQAGSTLVHFAEDIYSHGGLEVANHQNETSDKAGPAKEEQVGIHLARSGNKGELIARLGDNGNRGRPESNQDERQETFHDSADNESRSHRNNVHESDYGGDRKCKCRASNCPLGSFIGIFSVVFLK